MRTLHNLVMDAAAPQIHETRPLLSPDEPPVFEFINPTGAAPVFFICCHAGRAVPRALGDLGLDDDVRARHIGWDIGAAEITRRLSRRLDAPAVLANYSRLVIDLNRVPGTPDSIPEVSDATLVPGNLGIDDDARAQRVEAIFWPYHNGVAEAFLGRWRRGRPCALVAIHTFTPRLNGGTLRPWEAGMLWNNDARMAMPMIDHLRCEGFTVGDNEPYSGRVRGFSVEYHAGDAGLPSVGVEVRHDLVATAGGIERWTGLLAGALADALSADGLFPKTGSG